MDPKKKNVKKIKKMLKSFDPSKYVNTEPMMNEAKKNSIVISFGRMNPPTTGHEKLVNKVISEAVSRKADAGIYLSHTQDKKKNPLSYNDKINFAAKAFGKIIKKSNSRTIIEVAKELSKDYDNLILVVGSDRVQEFETLLKKYNGTEFNFSNIEVVSAGERDPDADDVSGMSASKLRSLAIEGNKKAFASGLPKRLKSLSDDVYNSIRNGLGLSEEVLEEARTPLTVQQRRRRGMTMRRLKNRLAIARKKAKRRLASKEKLDVRSKKKARNIIRQRLMKNKSYGEMSPSEKIALDKRLMRIPQAVIDRIAKRQLPSVRKAEVERLRSVLNPSSKNEEFEMFLEDYYAGLSKSTSSKRKAHFEKGKRMDDDNPAAYKPAPGDARAKTKPSIHTKRFKQMFGEELQEASERDTQPRKRYHMALEKNGSVKFDKRFKFFKKTLEESSENLLEEILDLQESVEEFLEESSKEALKNKAEKTGISYGVLKKVYDRGVAAWRTGHRPGTTPAQWGMARVNSFATKGKGTWGKADSDLAAKVRKEEVELEEANLNDIVWSKNVIKPGSSRKLTKTHKPGDKVKYAGGISTVVKHDERGFVTLSNPSWTKNRIVPHTATKKIDEEVSLNSFFDLNEQFELMEASIIDKALAAIHKHVMGGDDLMDIVWQVSRAKEVDIPGKQLYNKYIEKYGQPNKNNLNTARISKLKAKYGFSEQVNVARAKLQIAREKASDKEKHDRLLDTAADRDKSMKEEINKADPKNREHGTDSLVKILKGDTPGQTGTNENYYDSDITNSYGNFAKGSKVRFTDHSMDMVDNDERIGTVVGSNTQHLRVRDDKGMLFLVRHSDATEI
jgi:nicotinic acid mononucleotide adenylyltransferase